MIINNIKLKYLEDIFLRLGYLFFRAQLEHPTTCIDFMHDVNMKV